MACKAYIDYRKAFPVGWAKGSYFAHHDEPRFTQRTSCAACQVGEQKSLCPPYAMTVGAAHWPRAFSWKARE